MKQHLNSICYTAFVWIAALALWCGSTLSAEQLRYDSARDWRQWELPLGAVDLTALGVIQPTRIERTDRRRARLGRLRRRHPQRRLQPQSGPLRHRWRPGNRLGTRPGSQTRELVSRSQSRPRRLGQ